MPGIIARMFVVVIVLWLYFVAVLALTNRALPGGIEASLARLDLLIAAAVLTAALWGLRMLASKVGRRAYAHAVGSTAVVGLITSIATGVDGGFGRALLTGAGLSLGVVVAGIGVARVSRDGATQGNAPSPIP